MQKTLTSGLLTLAVAGPSACATDAAHVTRADTQTK